jgi:hypothetical protein
VSLATLLDGFTIVPLRQDDEAVQSRATAFFKRLGLAKPRRPDALKWLGFAKGDTISLVIAAWVCPDNSVEITDFYPAATRDGVKAGYVGLRLLKLLVDEGIIPYWFGGIVAANKTGQRRAERYFGITPRSIVYCYDGGP